MQTKLPLQFGGGCIFDKMEIPDDNQWIFDLIDKCDREHAEIYPPKPKKFNSRRMIAMRGL